MQKSLSYILYGVSDVGQRPLLLPWQRYWNSAAMLNYTGLCRQMGENFLLLPMFWLVPSVLWRCWLGDRKGIRPVKKTEWWGAGVVICLERGADLHMPSWCHCRSLSLAPVKSRLVLPFWYRLTRVVPDKGPLNGCVCVCVCECDNWWLLEWNWMWMQRFIYFTASPWHVNRKSSHYSVCVCLHAVMWHRLFI